jgi:hypothetical protein
MAEAPDHTRRYFFPFLVAHVVFWTALTTVVRPNPGLDLAESVYLGHEWQLGYPKHPPLPSWIAGAAAAASDHALWALYLASQLVVAFSIWAAWRMAREVLPPRAALLAACLLECCPFYSLLGMEVNNNVGLYPCWALAALYLFLALETDRKRSWAAAGLWLGLGMLAKYTTVVLVVTMLGFSVLHPKARAAWRRPGPYLTMFVALAVFSPHVYWAVEHNLPAVSYAIFHAPRQSDWLGHIRNPFGFAGYQLLMLSPIFLVLLPLTGYRWRLRALDDRSRFARDFLAAVVLGPFAIHLALSLALNIVLRGPYGSPMWTFVGVLMLLSLELRPEPSRWRKAWRRWAAMAIGLALCWAVGAWVRPYVEEKPVRGLFPGRTFAAAVERAWSDRYAGPLPIVAGDYWLAGNAAFYGPSRPRVFASTAQRDWGEGVWECPWITDDEFRKRGGAILWDMEKCPEGLSPEVLERFGVREVVELPPLGYQTGAEVPPVRAAAAIVPPGQE